MQYVRRTLPEPLPSLPITRIQYSMEEIWLSASFLGLLGRLINRHFGEARWLVLGAVALKRSAPFTCVCPLRSLSDTAVIAH